MASPADAVVVHQPRNTLGGIVVGPPEIRHALVLSLWDGTFATAMVALTETFGIAAAVSLKAPSMAIALLGSTPLLLGSLGQYFWPAVVDVRGPRKPGVLVGVGLQSMFLVLAACAGFDFGSLRGGGFGFPVPRAQELFVAAAALSGRVRLHLGGVVRLSVGADLSVPFLRGRFFFDAPDGSRREVFVTSPVAGSADLSIGVEL